MKKVLQKLPAAIVNGKPAGQCRHCIFLLMGIQFLLLALCPSASTGADTFHTTVGFSHSTLLDLDKERAQAITALWSSLVAKKWGTTSATICKSVPDLEMNIRSKKIDLVVLTSLEYLEFSEKAPLEPLFVSAKGNDIYDRIILVVRKDSGIRSVKGLRGKTVVQLQSFFGNGRNLWLDTVLMRKGERNPDRFFSKTRGVLKPSAAILPVFFRKEDACVVTVRCLQVMSELNPQLKRELLVLEESPPRPMSVIAVRKGLAVKHREMLRDILQTLDQSVQGRQLLTLFRMDRLVPYRPEYMTRLKELFMEYDNHKIRLANRK